jgi:hypothetical protein
MFKSMQCLFGTIPDDAAACYDGAEAFYNGTAACHMMDKTKIKLTQPSGAVAWAEPGKNKTRQ